MNPIADAWCIQIEVNNVCPGRCSYCTRFNSHLRPNQRFGITPNTLREIISSLEAQGYTGKLGFIGGEPTIHPQFQELCSIVYELWTSKDRWFALWSSGGKKYLEQEALIAATFSWVAFNDHRDPNCHHQRMTMGSQDVVPDEKFRAELIDNCWVQRIWCPTINPKGAFFCECAAAWDLILDGPGGWSLNEPWLSYGPSDYRSQMCCCQLCGMAVPMQADGVHDREKFSKGTLHALKHVNALKLPPDHDCDFVDRAEYDRRVNDWEPGEYTPGRAKGGA